MSYSISGTETGRITTTRETEYVVYIPDETYPNNRRQVGCYAELEDGERGIDKAREHMNRLHQLSKEIDLNSTNRSNVYVVVRITETSEARLV